MALDRYSRELPWRNAEAGRPFSESQLEARAMAVRNAYKVARQLVIDIAKPAE